jgi:hypothetical protein
VDADDRPAADCSLPGRRRDAAKSAVCGLRSAVCGLLAGAASPTPALRFPHSAGSIVRAISNASGPARRIRKSAAAPPAHSSPQSTSRACNKSGLQEPRCRRPSLHIPRLLLLLLRSRARLLPIRARVPRTRCLCRWHHWHCITRVAHALARRTHQHHRGPQRPPRSSLRPPSSSPSPSLCTLGRLLRAKHRNHPNRQS